jgi:hypothetical protein
MVVKLLQSVHLRVHPSQPPVQAGQAGPRARPVQNPSLVMELGVSLNPGGNPDIILKLVIFNTINMT